MIADSSACLDFATPSRRSVSRLLFVADATPIRRNYITALQAADARDMAPLLAFARS